MQQSGFIIHISVFALVNLFQFLLQFFVLFLSRVILQWDSQQDSKEYWINTVVDRFEIKEKKFSKWLYNQNGNVFLYSISKVLGVNCKAKSCKLINNKQKGETLVKNINIIMKILNPQALKKLIKLLHLLENQQYHMEHLQYFSPCTKHRRHSR